MRAARTPSERILKTSPSQSSSSTTSRLFTPDKTETIRPFYAAIATVISGAIRFVLFYFIVIFLFFFFTFSLCSSTLSFSFHDFKHLINSYKTSRDEYCAFCSNNTQLHRHLLESLRFHFEILLINTR